MPRYVSISWTSPNLLSQLSTASPNGVDILGALEREFSFFFGFAAAWHSRTASIFLVGIYRMCQGFFIVARFLSLQFIFHAAERLHPTACAFFLS
jgi:hypothetical protein